MGHLGIKMRRHPDNRFLSRLQHRSLQKLLRLQAAGVRPNLQNLEMGDCTLKELAARGLVAVTVALTPTGEAMAKGRAVK